MHTLTLVDIPDEHGKPRTHEFTFPGAWEELTPLQLGQVVLLRSSGINEDALKYRMLRMLASIPKRLFERMHMGDVIEFVSGKLYAIKELNFLFAEPVFEKSLVHEFKLSSHRRVAGVRLPGTVRWQGPKNQLKNFTVLQFSMADHCLQVLQASKSTEALNNLLGALYHPEGEPWNAAGIEQRGHALSVLPLHLKLAAVFNYQAVRAGLPALYPHTFGKRKDDDAPDFGIDGLMEALAGDKFGEVDRVGDKPLTAALINCERARLLQLEMEKQSQE
jgi:hypothetical protein